MIASASTHPIDLVKVRVQLSGTKEGMLSTGIGVMEKEGITALYKGLTASLFRQATYTSCRIGLYLILKERATGEDGSFPLWKKIVVGMLAGAGGALAGNPADVVMVRMQADGKLPIDQRRNYKHAFDGLARIISKEGIATLWKASGPNMQRAMFMTAGQLASYDQAKQFLLQTGYFKDDFITYVTGSLFAAFVAAAITSPLDIIKTKMMNMQNKEYSSNFNCYVKTYNNGGGLGAFYKGFLPYYLRLGPHTIITFLALEQLSKLLDHLLGKKRE